MFSSSCRHGGREERERGMVFLRIAAGGGLGSVFSVSVACGLGKKESEKWSEEA